MTADELETEAAALQLLGERHTRKTEEMHASRAELKVAVNAVLAAGMSEAEAARLAGVTRMTVRAWAGK